MLTFPSHAQVVIPDAVTFVPGWIPAADASALQDAIVAETITTWKAQLHYGKGRPYMDKGHTMSRYGAPGVTYSYRNKPKPVHPMTQGLTQVQDRLSALLGWQPNCCVINTYAPASGLYPHSDGKYIPQLGAQPIIAAVSFGATRSFILHPFDGKKRSKDVVTVNLGHGDLVVMHGRCDSDFQHSIPVEPDASGVRISLTFRKHSL